MSDTPKKIEFIIMKVSASELDIARSVAFIVSEETDPFFFMISIDGLM